MGKNLKKNKRIDILKSQKFAGMQHQLLSITSPSSL